MAKIRIMQITQYNRTGSLVFWTQNAGQNRGFSWSWSRYISETVQDRNIITMKAKRNLYALWLTMLSPVTLSDL